MYRKMGSLRPFSTLSASYLLHLITLDHISPKPMRELIENVLKAVGIVS